MFPLPSRISRYDIKALIESGGMGSLYLARDSNPNTNRLVALKLLLANLDSSDLRERFAREARALAALNHPNIVGIYDSGEFQGSPFIVMEYVRGETVAEKIKRRAPMSMSQKLTLMMEMCSGLAHAHEAGIIHRDIKPANLMMDLQGRLKILDFGIARMAEGLTQTGLQMTQLNVRIGSPGYMSPEQIEGLEIDQRTDLFAVGSVCYELLSYRKAFTGTTTRQIENQVLQAQPVALTSLVEGLDPEIEAIVFRALDKDRDNRYQDASTIEEALERQRWRMGPADTPGAVNKPTPVPIPIERRRPERADAAYQRSLALFKEGANEAARRFAIEALAENSGHEDARAFLERLDPEAWRRTIVPAPVPAETTAPTALSSDFRGVERRAEPATVLSKAADPTGESSFARRFRALGRRSGRGAEIAAIVGGVAVIVGIATAIGLWLWPGGHVLTINPPVGGTISGMGINCGTARADCRAEFAKGTNVELRAEPDPGFVLGGFNGDCAQNGRTTMSAPRICGATFTRVEGTRGEVMHLLDVVKPDHGTIVGPGIQCGSLGSECSAEHPEGREIILRPLADEKYVFRGFTGDCLKNGDVVMRGPRRCAAIFQLRAPDGRLTDGGRGRGGEGRGRDGGGRGEKGPPPEAVAKDEIQRLLKEYSTAYERLDLVGIKRVFPGAPLAGLRRAFNQYKSAEYTYTGDFEFIDLDAALGTATVKVGALLTPQYKGPRLAPQKLLNLFKLARHDGTWTIRELKTTQK